MLIVDTCIVPSFRRDDGLRCACGLYCAASAGMRQRQIERQTCALLLAQVHMDFRSTKHNYPSMDFKIV